MSLVFSHIPSVLLEPRLNPLGPGTPNLAMRAQLQQVERDLPARGRHREFALACVAGLWLVHDFLDESHAISQDLDTAEGSYWHALMHRREPDFWNSKYWFRRCPRHSVFTELVNEAAVLARESATPPGCAFLATQPAWDPGAFVDLCESVSDEASVKLCQRIQRCEWELLFRFCHERAFGS